MIKLRQPPPPKEFAKLDGERVEILFRQGTGMAKVRWPDGTTGAVPNKRLLPLQMRQVEANKQQPQTKETVMPTAPKSDKIVEAFGMRDGTNYARMLDHLAKNVGKQVKVDELARAAYKAGDHDKAKRRVVTMSRKVQDGIIVKKRLPYKIVKEKSDDGVTIGLHNK